MGIEEKFDRREALMAIRDTLGALTGIISLTSGRHASAEELPNPANANFADWYNSAVRNISGKHFAHPSFPIEEIQLSKEQLGLHLKKVHEELIRLSTLGRYEWGTNDSKLVRAIKEPYFISFDADERQWADYQKIMGQEYRQFAAQCGSESSGFPDIHFEKLSPAAKLDKKIPGTIPAYIIKRIGAYRRAIFSIGKGSEETKITTTKDLSDLGSSEFTVKWEFQENSVSFAPKENPHILVSIGNKPEEAIDALLSEMLHATMRPITVSHIIREANDAYDQIKGKPPDLRDMQMSELTDKWFHREEGFVHAAVRKYLIGQRERLGLNPANFLDLSKHTSRYELVEPVGLKIREIPLINAFFDYKENPGRLFGK